MSDLQQSAEIATTVETIVRHFVLTFPENGKEQCTKLPIPAMVPVVCAFVQQVPEAVKVSTDCERYVGVLGGSISSFKRYEAKIAILQTMMSLQPQGGPWFFPSVCQILKLEQVYSPAQQVLKTWSKQGRLPRAVRVQHELDKRWNLPPLMGRLEVRNWITHLFCTVFGSVPQGLDLAPPDLRQELQEKLSNFN